MKWSLLLLLCVCIKLNAGQLPNLLNTTQHDCVRCLCHAVSGCYVLANCARYSIPYSYWQQAGSPVIDNNDTPSMESYTKCINNDNCIVHTIENYTRRGGQMDCNCDNQFTCEDKLMIHFDRCENPSAITQIEARRQKYRSCSAVSLKMPLENCIPEPV